MDDPTPMKGAASEPSHLSKLQLPQNVAEDLPSYLVKPFKYCCLFPKGHRFVREFLVHQWLAHKLIPLEDIGNSYFEELLSRGLFQDPIFVFGHGDSCRRVYSCAMHYEACRLTADDHLKFDRRVYDDYSSLVTQEIQHIAFHKDGFSQLNLEKAMEVCNDLKTLICLSPHWNAFPNSRSDVSSGLRVLDLPGCQFKELPFTKLVSLVYLRLSGNVLLQKFDAHLFPSLETLAVDGCVRLETIGRSTSPMPLKHLYLTTRQKLLDLDRNLTTMELTHCVHLDALTGILDMVKIMRIFDCPILRRLPTSAVLAYHIEELILHNCAAVCLDYELARLQHYQQRSSYAFKKVKRLELVGLSVRQLPNWVQFIENLQYLLVDDCPQLEKLKHLRYVEELYIYNCPKLRSLSVPLDSLPAMRLLDIRNCPKLSLKHKSSAPDKLFSNIKGVFGAFQSRSSADIKLTSSFHSSSTSGVTSPSVSSAPNIFLDGKPQRQKNTFSTQNATKTEAHSLQRVPYFIVKSQMSKTGLQTNNHWHTLRLVFKAIATMRAIVIPGRELAKLHCCLFPNDYEFEREKLIQLWMAVGLLKENLMEIDGNLKFELLLREQYILLARIDSSTRRKYKVNGDKVATLLNGVQTTTNKNMYVMLEDETATVDESKYWHLSLVSNHFDQATFETLKNFKELRTLLFVHNYGSSLKQIPSYMFLVLRSIQALDLSGSHIVELPNSIGNAIHLRYLDLSFTLIESLPESIDRLHQLQTLKLEGCKHIHILPKGMKELRSLRYLDFDIMGQLTCMPKGIGALTELRKLSAFVMDSKESCSIRELKNMNNLMGSICISGLENASEHDALEANLSNKKHLTRLQLRWSDFKCYSSVKRHDVDWTFRDLKPDSCLEELHVLHYPGFRLPVWIGSAEFHKLVNITLLKCANEELHTAFGKLPNLKHFCIIQMYKLTKISRLVHELYDAPGTFPKLETLIIDGMPNLEEWSGPSESDFPILSKLIIKQCPKLSVLPFLSCLLSLKHLEISQCERFTSLSHSQTLPSSLQTLVINNCPSLKKRCMVESDDWSKIQHVPEILIDLEDVRSTRAATATDDSSIGSHSNSDSDSYVQEGDD